MAREMVIPLKAVEAPYRQIDRELEETAAVCGASWMRTTRTVLFPLARPALAGGAVLVFIAAFREIGASAILFSHGSEVTGSELMRLLGDGSYQAIGALAVASAALCLIVAFLLNFLLGRNRVSASG